MDTKFSILLACVVSLVAARTAVVRDEDAAQQPEHVDILPTSSEDYTVDQNFVLDHWSLSGESDEEESHETPSSSSSGEDESVADHEDIWFPPGYDNDADFNYEEEENKGHHETVNVDGIEETEGNEYDDGEDHEEEYYKEYQEFIHEGHEHEHDGKGEEKGSNTPPPPPSPVGDKQNENKGEKASEGGPKVESGDQNESKNESPQPAPGSPQGNQDVKQEASQNAQKN